MDMAGNVRRAGPSLATNGTDWRAGYGQQIAFRRSQIDRIQEFAETQQCRMTALIRHFGDIADGVRPCGHCDFCAPASTLAQSFAEPSAAEDRDLRAILQALDGAVPRATGRLFTDLALKGDRKHFDRLLEGLARAGLAGFHADTFTNPDGKVISYKKVSLTYEGQTLAPGAPLGVVLQSASAETGAKSSRPATGKAAKDRKQERQDLAASFTPEQQQLAAALKAWRSRQAAPSGRPAFMILTDAVLHSVVLARPRTLPRLAEVAGIGQSKIDAYGADICAICRGESGTAPPEQPTTELSTRKVVRQARSDQGSPVRSRRSKTSPDTQDFQEPDQWQIAAAATPPEPEPARLRAIAPAPATFTEDQQALEVRLRDWHKTESEKLGLPQFFILGTTALRSIVVSRPQTLGQLGSIPGIGREKLDRFGPSILEVCSSLTPVASA